jgi:hypothetical protein
MQVCAGRLCHAGAVTGADMSSGLTLEFSCKAAGLEPCCRCGTLRGLVSCNVLRCTRDAIIVSQYPQGCGSFRLASLYLNLGGSMRTNMFVALALITAIGISCTQDASPLAPAKVKESLAPVAPALALAAGLITACARDVNGQLRTIDSSTSCNSGELRLEWNIQGEPGPQGAPGPGLGGVTGRWEGTVTITGSSCSNVGPGTLVAVLVEVPGGSITGSIRVSGAGSSAVLGSHTASQVTFDSGGNSILFQGTLQTPDALSGTIGPASPSTTCPQGTWSAHRVL